MTADLETSFPEELVAGYQQKGAVRLPGAFEPWVESLRRGVETNLREPGRTSPPFPGIDLEDGDRLREDWFPVIWTSP